MKQLSVVVTEEEHAALKMHCKVEKITMSQYVKDALISKNEANKEKIEAKPETNLPEHFDGISDINTLLFSLSDIHEELDYESIEIKEHSTLKALIEAIGRIGQAKEKVRTLIEKFDIPLKCCDQCEMN